MASSRASWRHGPDPPRPEAVGILAIEVYIPTQMVSMADMEDADGCPGKYTQGLGQEHMAFVSDREDAISMALTVTQSLLEKYGVRPEEVGHLQVGTESGLDRSKSIKSHLMALFTSPSSSSSPPCSPLGPGPPAEGADCLHACYGATAALLNAVAWVESRRWDGRLAVVVAADVALYAPGSAARPTGGCGAAALLIGPRAALALDPLWHASHAQHAWDFWKPLSALPYPAVDGPATLGQYLRAVGECGAALAGRLQAAGELAEGEALLPAVDLYVAHAPLAKLARKGLGRLVLGDALRARGAARGAEMDADGGAEAPGAPPAAAEAAGASADAQSGGDADAGAYHSEVLPAVWRLIREAEGAEGGGDGEGGGGRPGEAPPPACPACPSQYGSWRLGDRALEAGLLAACGGLYGRLCGDSAWLQRQVGNAYTASLWQGLAAAVWRRGAGLAGRRLLLFSFGSGTLASLVSLVGVGDSGQGREGQRTLGAAGPEPGADRPACGAPPAAAAANGTDPRFSLAAMQAALDLDARLSRRMARSVGHYDAVSAQVEASYGTSGGGGAGGAAARACGVPYEPAGDLGDVTAGAYYLVQVDERGRRWYERRGGGAGGEQRGAG